MKTKFIQLGYLLGISLLLTSVFYFFASNWQGFERSSKVVLSIMIMIVFYSGSFFLARYLKQQSFLNKWLFVGGSISFGISTALIGQLYNSHADSYQLFLVWLIPVFLFCIVTKYKPMYILGYLLFHMTIYFYMNPTTYYVHWNETELLLILVGVAIFNAFLHYYVKSSFIHYMSFIVFHLLMIFSTMLDAFPTYTIFMNIVYIAILLYEFFRYYKRGQNKMMMVLYGFVGTAFLITKGFELVTRYFGELFFVFLFGVVILLLAGSVKLLQIIKSHPANHTVKTVIIVSVTVIATIFATIAIMGFLALVFQTIPLTVLFSIGLILVIIGFISKHQVMVSYTLLCTGYVIATLTSVFDDKVILKLMLIGVLIVIFKKVDTKGMRVFQYLLLNIMIFSLIREWVSVIEWAFIFLLVLNSGYYVFTRYKVAFFFLLGYFISLTMTSEISGLFTLLYNLSFFVVVTILIFWAKKRDRSFEFYMGLAFWFLFIGYKYYDLLWTLIHKSILFFALGFLFLMISMITERKNAIKNIETSFVSKKWLPILLVILLQFGFVGYQAKSSETLLMEGHEITLSLKPVDPRSLLQGDYVNLRYNITDISGIEDLKDSKGLIKVVVRKSENGIYEYAGYYQYRGKWNKPYHALQEDVVINGRLNGAYEIIYGIETYFVPEETGGALEREAKFAKVKVSKNGNSILVKVY